MDDNILLNAQEALKKETNEERRGFIQHIINTEELRRERRMLCDYFYNIKDKELHPEEHEEISKQLNENMNALKDISLKFTTNYPKDVMKAYKKFSAAFDAHLYEVWIAGEEHESYGTREIELKDSCLSKEGIGSSFLGYNHPNFNIGDYCCYFFPMYVVICNRDVSWFELIYIEDVSATYENQMFTEKRNMISSVETSRYIYLGEYRFPKQTFLYSREVIRSEMYGKLTFLPFDITLYTSNLRKGEKLFNAINEYVDFIRSKKGLVSNNVGQVIKQDRNKPTEQIALYNEYNYNETIEVSYTVFGYDRLGETTFDMEVKEKDYEWLQDAESEEGELTSDYISENRKGLHKRIINAIRKNMKEESYDPDDGMVEYYSAGVHHKDFFEDASYDYASFLADDDDIEYTVTV